jgi:hypothetical protein
LNDLAIQYYICKVRFGDKLNSFNLVLRTDEAGEKWSILDLKNDLEELQAEVKNKINGFKTILKEDEPNISMREQCNQPYECEFIEYCKNKC